MAADPIRPLARPSHQTSNWKDGMHALVLSQADGGAVAMDEPTKLLEHEAVLLV
jgi:hypothetical protein